MPIKKQSAEKLPNARRVVDRFHVMKNLNDALTKARRTIQKDADEKTKEAAERLPLAVGQKPREPDG